MWLSASGELPLIGHFLGEPATAYLFAWGGLVFDLLIAFAVCVPRIRAWAFGLAVLFHAMTAWLFPIGLFPWVMTLGASLFFAPDWPRVLTYRLLLRVGPAPLSVAARPTVQRPIALWCLAAWFLVQVAMPLRTLLGPADLHWHERGFRFGWRVMVMEKTAVARFELRENGETQGRWSAPPKGPLTPFQVRQMSTQPDMLVQFARHLAQKYQAETGLAVSVLAEVWASLNGRPAEMLLDANADLVARPLRPAHAYVRPRRRPR